MKKLILASLILASSQMAMAANWVYIGQDIKTLIDIKQNGEIVYGTSDVYIDKDSIMFKAMPDGRPYISVWGKTIYKEPFVARIGKSVYHVYQFKSISYYDCKNKTWDSGYIGAYDKDGNIIPDNNLTFTIMNTKRLKDNFIPNNWLRIIPDTQLERTFNSVCSWVKMN